MGESPEVRYKVCLIASTCGSVAAASKKRTTDELKESYGWCSKISCLLIAAKYSSFDSRSISRSSCATWFLNGANLSSGLSKSAIRFSPVKSSGSLYLKISSSLIESSSFNRFNKSESISLATSRRTGGPNFLRSNSCSIDSSKFSDSSSSSSKSAFLVMRKV